MNIESWRKIVTFVRPIALLVCITGITAQTFVVFDAPNASATEAVAINEGGDIAGEFRDSAMGNKLRGFVRLRDGTVAVFDAPNTEGANTWTVSRVIAANGDVIGFSSDGSREHGFVRHSDGHFTMFDAPNAIDTEVTAVNDDGEIVGYFSDGSQGRKERAYVRDHVGAFTVFDAPNALWTAAFGINFRSDVTGYFADASHGNRERGFVRGPDGQFTLFDVPNAFATECKSINDDMEIAGHFSDLSQGNRQRGFVRHGNGDFSTFDAPNVANTLPTFVQSINASGTVAGYFGDKTYSNRERSFLRDHDGNFTTFDAPNAYATEVVSINDHGDAAGYFFDASEELGLLRQRAFVRSIQDTTPPNTSINFSPSPNASGWNNTNVTVNLTSIDNPGGAGVKQIQFNLGNTGWQTVAGNTASVVISAEGTTILSYYATDNTGNKEATKTLTIKIDKTPPAVSGMPVLGCRLWPPNHNMIQVATVGATDALSGVVPGSFSVIGTSNEPSDPNNPDIVITPNGSGGYVVQLRADRLGTGTGRVYTLNATASDLAGNAATVTAACTVPHDMGQ